MPAAPRQAEELCGLAAFVAGDDFVLRWWRAPDS
jgi:hypothetical protein